MQAPRGCGPGPFGALSISRICPGVCPGLALKPRFRVGRFREADRTSLWLRYVCSLPGVEGNRGLWAWPAL
ncbi:MAG: hypothetical protein ACREVP_11940, partial [Burkholderiales bacterium]